MSRVYHLSLLQFGILRDSDDIIDFKKNKYMAAVFNIEVILQKVLLIGILIALVAYLNTSFFYFI